MPVVLRKSTELPEPVAYERWCAVAGATATIDTRPTVKNLGIRLEKAFEAIRDRWWELGRALGATPSAELAHMPTCGTYTSDFGVMLAWAKLVGELASETSRTLVLCDDPWLFRHLSRLPGVKAGKPPKLLLTTLWLFLRGFIARFHVALRVMIRSRRTQTMRGAHGRGEAIFLVYAHPISDTKGKDAYFGDLMKAIPETKRLLHTLPPNEHGIHLCDDERTACVDAWGSLLTAVTLPFALWRPSKKEKNLAEGWLIRRAASLEGGSGSAAVNRWQIACQTSWLIDRRPRSVIWPWENHPWERALVRTARRLGILTAGYQHTVIGPHMFNQSPASNPDGLDSIPDLIICNGPAYYNNLVEWGIPEERLVIGGALRLAQPGKLRHDPDGPVFVALSNDDAFAWQMIDTLKKIDTGQKRFLIKSHPYFSIDFEETDTIRCTNTMLQDQTGVSAVIYCTGTVGLEAILGGLPTIRFRPNGYVAMNILPSGITVETVDAYSLADALSNMKKPPAYSWNDVLAPENIEVWKRVLSAELLETE